MKKLLIGLTLTLGAIATVYFLKNHSLTNRRFIHYHAGFTVFVDGHKQDFSGYQYMNFTPCTEHDASKSPIEEQMEKAHLHDGVGDVVHVHREGAIWSDLFQNIKFPIQGNITGYVEGKEVKNIMTSPIIANESVIFVVGNQQQADLNAYVTLDRIREIEAKSELCGKN